jgi:hypothetical protein
LPFFVAFLARAPGELRSPWLTMVLSVELFAVAAAAVIGDLLYRLVGDEWRTRRDLAERRRQLDQAVAQAGRIHDELTELNQSLEVRVVAGSQAVRVLVGQLDELHEDERRAAAQALKGRLMPALDALEKELSGLDLGAMMQLVDGGIAATRELLTQLRP